MMKIQIGRSYVLAQTQASGELVVRTIAPTTRRPGNPMWEVEDIVGKRRLEVPESDLQEIRQ